MFQPRDIARLQDSAQLVDLPVDGNDKVFLLAHIKAGLGKFDIHFDDGMPTCAFNDKVRQENGLAIPLYADAAKPEGFLWNGIKLSHVSAGGWFWTNEPDPRLLAIERNDPKFSGFLTNPGGRCTESPLLTLYKESVEEACIVHNDRIVMPDLSHFSAATAAGLIDFKRQQVSEKRRPLEREGVNIERTLRNDPVFMPEIFPPEDRALAQEISVFNRGRMIAHFRAVAIWLPDINVLDLSRSFRLPKGGKLVAVDGEEYNRAVSFERPTDIRQRNTLPHVKWLFDNRGQGQPAGAA